VSRIGDWVRWTFAPPAITEAAPKVVAATAAPRRGYEFGIPAQGITEANSSSQSNIGADRGSVMNDLYDVFLACPWSWAATNAVARTITGGGVEFTWEGDDGEGDQEVPPKPRQVLEAERLLKYVNPREDIIQLLRGVIADLEVFGDAFLEVVWAGGIPVALYSLDCPSTTPIADPHGNVTGYLQHTDQGQKARFKPHEVIHFSLDAPRSGLFGVSPTYAALLPIKTWLFTMATLKELFRKGLPAHLWVDMPAGMQPAEMDKWSDQHMTRNVGTSNIGRPVLTRGGATIKELQQNRIDEILHVLDQQRDAVLASYGVPPAEAGVIESGNLGGGTGEAQHKQFLVNTCQPIAALVMEKLNFVLLQAFGITGWTLRFGEVDLRDSKTIEEIRKMRIDTGQWTLDRARAEIGEPPTPGGDQPIYVERTGVLLWRDMEASSVAGVASKLKGTALEPDEPSEGKPMTIAKPEPKPVPAALQAFAGGGAEGDEDGTGAVPGQQVPPAPGKAEDDDQGAARKAGKKAEGAQLRGLPTREGWGRYQARIREAMSELDRAA
jgi:HK97 family phage portal protein